VSRLVLVRPLTADERRACITYLDRQARAKAKADGRAFATKPRKQVRARAAD
jgi:hypothetical protein